MGKIVWLASYPKSGNTWVRAFLHNYITEAAAPTSINALTDFSATECAAAFFHKPGEPLTTEATQRLRPAVQQSLTKLHDDLVFIKTHNANLAVHNIPLCTPAHTAGTILIVRDPRDVALSYSAFTGKPLDDIIAFMANPRAANRATDRQVFEFLSSWSTHVESWASAPRKILARYEDLLADPEKYFARIIDFLGGPPEPERLRRAIEFSDFKTLSAQETQHGYVAGGPAGLFFRAGKSGGWRDTLTRAQAARIEADHRDVMRKCGYIG
jgi:Sulfotransferase domain